MDQKRDIGDQIAVFCAVRTGWIGNFIEIFYGFVFFLNFIFYKVIQIFILFPLVR